MTMSRPTENILEDILDQLSSGNGGNSNGVQQLTADNIADAIERGRNRRTTNRGSRSAPAKTRGEQLGETAKATAKGLAAANTVHDTTKVLGMGLSGVAKVVPGVGNALSTMTEGFVKFYEFMDGNLTNYKEFNSAGFQATNGMMGLYKAVGTSRLSFEEFNGIAKDYNHTLASLGADGAQQFGSMLSSVIDSEASLGALNLTYEKMGSYLASSIKQQKAYGVFDSLDRDARLESNRQYMTDLNTYSKNLGMSTDELAKKLDKSAVSASGMATANALQRSGMDPAMAEKVTRQFNILATSMGPIGEELQTQGARMMAFGGQFDKDSVLGKMMLVSPELKSGVDGILGLMKSGKLSSEEGMKLAAEQLSGDKMMKALRDKEHVLRSKWGDSEYNRISAMIDQSKDFTLKGAAANDFWGQQLTDLNNSVSSMVSMFKIGTADLIMNPSAFIKNVFGEKWGNWLLTGAFDFSVPDTPYVASATEFVETLLSPLGWIYDSLMGYGSGVADKFSAIQQPSWQKIVKALVPEWLADIIFDQSGEIAGAADMGAKLYEGVDGLATSTVEWLEESGKAFGKFKVNEMKSAFGAAEEMGNAISKWWNTPAAASVITNNVTQATQTNKTVSVQSAANGPEYKSELLAEIKKMNEMGQDGSMNQMVKELQRANSNSEQQVRLLRKQLAAKSVRVN